MAALSPAPITWVQVKGEVSRDKVSSMLCSQIEDGFPDWGPGSLGILSSQLIFGHIRILFMLFIHILIIR